MMRTNSSMRAPAALDDAELGRQPQQRGLQLGLLPALPAAGATRSPTGTAQRRCRSGISASTGAQAAAR